jgi:hypothetical protein
MVDPRGGAYTVGLGVVRNLAVFPYHGTAAAHLLQRSIELLPPTAVLVGIDEDTALVLDGGTWRVAGAGSVTVYSGADAVSYRAGEAPAGLPTRAGLRSGLSIVTEFTYACCGAPAESPSRRAIFCNGRPLASM